MKIKINRLIFLAILSTLLLISGCSSNGGNSNSSQSETVIEDKSFDIDRLYGRWEEDNGDSVITMTSSRVYYSHGSSSTYRDDPDLKTDEITLHIGLSDLQDMTIEEGEPLKIYNDTHTFYQKENWSEASFDKNAGPVSVSEGEKISLDFVELQFDEDDIVNEIKFSNTTGGGSGYGGHITITQVIESEQAGKKFIYLKGTLKNLATYPIDPEQMKVVLMINDKYELEGKVSAMDEGASSVYHLDPLNTAIIYLDAPIDSSSVGDIEKLDWYIGFEQSFSGNDRGNPKGSRYYYQINVK